MKPIWIIFWQQTMENDNDKQLWFFENFWTYCWGVTTNTPARFFTRTKIQTSSNGAKLSSVRTRMMASMAGQFFLVREYTESPAVYWPNLNLYEN